MKTRNFLNRWCFFMLIALIGTTFTACSDDDDKDDTPPYSPGTITATQSAFTCYSMEGTIQIPVQVSNPDCTIDPALFGFSNYSLQGSSPIDGIRALAPSEQFLRITNVEPDGKGGYILSAEFAYPSYEYITVKATLTYKDTHTAIPIKQECYDAFRITAGHIGAGLMSELRFDVNEDNAFLPADIKEALAHLTLTSLKAVGAHADNVTFKYMDNGKGFIVLNNSFGLTPQEVQAGGAEVKISAEMIGEATTIKLGGTLKACPFRTLDPVTFSDEDLKWNWAVEEAFEQLGVEMIDGEKINKNDLTFYVAMKDKPLVDMDDLGEDVNIFSNTSVEYENGEYVHTCIGLMGMNTLQPGNYVLVAHLKKSLDENDDKFVDIQMPFTKE